METYQDQLWQHIMTFLCIRMIPSLSYQDQLLFPASADLCRDVAGRWGEHWGALGRREEAAEDGSLGSVVPG